MDGRARRFWVFAVFLLLVPVTMYLVLAVRTPQLCEGDQLEVRDCRWCAGSGRWAEEGGPGPLGDRCAGCGGTGKVRVIVPGDRRPTEVRGAIVDAATVEPFATYDLVRPRFGPPVSIFGREAVRLGGAKATFRHDSGEELVEEVNRLGLFNRRLRPGRWTVTVEAAGFAPFSGDFVVPRLTAPIWLEEARIVGESEGPEEAQSRWGLHLLAALGRPGGEPGWITVSPGCP